MAVKLLLPDSDEADPYGRQRLRREALTACRFNHPNLVQVLDCGTNVVVVEDEDGTHRYDELYVVMELLDGQTLREHLQQAGSLALRRAVSIARQVAIGLAEIHSKGVVHRDLKPANIMLTHDYKGDMLVKIVDFGAVKFIGRSSVLDDVDLTGTMMVGSARYTSPENCRGESLDERSDIYCLGLILYEMLAGRHPFDSMSRADLIYQHANVDPPSLDVVCNKAPARLVRLVMSSLEKLPKARPQSAAEFARALLDLASWGDASFGMEGDSGTTEQFGPANMKKTSTMEESPVEEETRIARHLTTNLHDSVRRIGATHSTPVPRGEAKRIALGLIYFITFLGAAVFFTLSFLSNGPSTAAGIVDSTVAETSSAAPVAEVGNKLLAATDINIRSEPSLNGEKIGLAEKGSRVQVISKSGNWREVVVIEHGRPKQDTTSEDRGWLDGALLQPPEE
jgi:serine/threonine-protein kinase